MPLERRGDRPAALLAILGTKPARTGCAYTSSVSLEEIPIDNRTKPARIDKVAECLDPSEDASRRAFLR